MSQTTQVGTVNYFYDDANRLVNVGGVNYTWDANGNLLSDGSSTYAYTNNKLSSITNTGDNLQIFYQYNGLGARVSQTVNSVTTHYVLDQAAGLTQVLADGTNTYLYGNDRIAQQSTSETEYFLTDALGSVRQLTNSEGEITLNRSYDPYGNVLASSGDGESVYAFTGEQVDSYSGLLNLRSRMYSPGMSRFLTKDSWQGDYTIPMTMNRWVYVSDNPVDFTDPSGYFLDPSEPTMRGTIIHKMIERQYATLYGLGFVDVNATINNGSTTWLRQNFRGGGKYDPNNNMNYATGYADILDYGERGLYEIKPQNALALGMATVQWYLAAWNVNHPERPFYPGIRYPGTPGVIVGTDPVNANNWIVGEEYFNGLATGVILYRSVSKNNGLPVPVYAFEWDPEMKDVTRKMPQQLALSPVMQTVINSVCELGGLYAISRIIQNNLPSLEPLLPLLGLP